MPASSIAPSAVDSAAYDELDQLMHEFPDWKAQHPDLAQAVNPPRYPKNKSGAPVQHDGELKVIKRSQTVPVTDYRATYKGAKVRPRSTKRPLLSPRDPNPPPMNFHTNQRDDYGPKEHQERVKPIIKGDEYQPPNDKFVTTTRYRSDFPAKSVELPKINPRATQATMKLSDHQMQSVTTNMEHYKSWGTKPATSYGDAPVFTGSLMYPDHDRYMDTTNAMTFRGEKGFRPPLVKQGDGNITIEGRTDFHTVNQMTYKPTHGAKRAEIMVRQPELVVKKRTQFNSKSQSMDDYTGRSAPARTRPVIPAQPTIDLRYDNSCSLGTEQRTQFKGVDAAKHPAPKPYKLKDNTEVSTDMMETMTSQKRDFRAIDVITHPPPVALGRPEQKMFNRDSMPKLESTTTNRQHYKPWDNAPRPRYDDFYEASMYARRDLYVPPTEKFDCKTTSSETYQGKFAPMVGSLKPEDKGVEKVGIHDFNSVYSLQFHAPSVARMLEKKQAAGLLKELRKRKMGPRTVMAK